MIAHLFRSLSPGVPGSVTLYTNRYRLFYTNLNLNSFVGQSQEESLLGNLSRQISQTNLVITDIETLADLGRLRTTFSGNEGWGMKYTFSLRLSVSLSQCLSLCVSLSLSLSLSLFLSLLLPLYLSLSPFSTFLPPCPLSLSLSLSLSLFHDVFPKPGYTSAPVSFLPYALKFKCTLDNFFKFLFHF